ncbi:MAG: hypothetical protein KDK30_05990 [Leptospiraceae bacterium]|nr:hypothetical protein [Leptospiraceae bacterium]MCB1320668.1 hypothetical protein [Leptospiraceae bacterium]
MNLFPERRFVFICMLIGFALAGSFGITSRGLQAQDGRIIYLAPIQSEANSVQADDLVLLRQVIRQELVLANYLPALPEDLRTHPSLNNIDPTNCEAECLLRVLRELPADMFWQPIIRPGSNGFVLEFRLYQLGEQDIIELERRPAPVYLTDFTESNIRRRVAHSLENFLKSDANRVADTSENRNGNTTNRNTGDEPGVYIVTPADARGVRLIAEPADSDVRVRRTVDSNGRLILDITVSRSGYRTAQLKLEHSQTENHVLVVQLEKASTASEPRIEQSERESSSNSAGTPPYWNALWRSALLPGWGQYYKNDDFTGGILMTLFFTSAMHLAFAEERYQHQMTEYRRYYELSSIFLYEMAAVATPTYNSQRSSLTSTQQYLIISMLQAADKKFLERQIDTCFIGGRCQRARRAKEYRDASIGLLALVYLYNLIDAAFLGGGTEYASAINKNNESNWNYELTSGPDDDGFGLRYAGSLTFHF